MSRDTTPHDSASRRCTSTNGVSAMIGTPGRSWEMRRAENPDSVNATMARGVEHERRASRAASEIASWKPYAVGPAPTIALDGLHGAARRARRPAPSPRPPRRDSARWRSRPSSMIASAPSKIAVETSETSARVGPEVRDHRLEHLRRDDHRHLRAAAPGE